MSIEIKQSKPSFRYGLHFKTKQDDYLMVDDDIKTDKSRHTYTKVNDNGESKAITFFGGSQPKPPKPTPPIKVSSPTPSVKPTLSQVPQPVKQETIKPTKITGTKRALLIGINYIGSDNALNGCIKDVENISNILTTLYNYKPENIMILTDDQHGSHKPTRKNIISNINKYVSLTKSGDELFVHYSGHGTQVADLNGDEALNPDAPGQDDALCPCDFDDYDGDSGFILDDLLKEILVNKIPVGAKLRAFFDCCHSGSALDLPFLYRLGEQFQRVEPLDKQSADCLLISGCKDNQTSADAYIGNQYSGALTWAIIQALTSAAKIPTTWKELLLIVRHSLALGKYTQIPMLSVGDQSIANYSIDL